MEYKEIEGNLITLALQGEFDVIAHGVNCFCTMGAGLAPQMAKTFGCHNFYKEGEKWKGNMCKLGTIVYENRTINLNTNQVINAKFHFKDLVESPKNYKKIKVVNCYTQYKYGTNHIDGEDKPLSYAALELCFKKMNYIFQGKHIGLPGFIGCGLAGGDWNIVKAMIQKEFKDCNVTVVIYNNK